MQQASVIPPIEQLLEDASIAFRRRFNCNPDYAACAPGRVNLIGEHTDYNDGYVFPMVSSHTHSHDIGYAFNSFY